MAGIVPQLALAVGLLLALIAALSLADRRRRRPQPLPEPVRRPVQVVAADLRRLSRQLAVVPAGAPLLRWRALWAAYDAVLGEAAAQLEIPHELPALPDGLARDLERLRLLAALEGAGLAVHD